MGAKREIQIRALKSAFGNDLPEKRDIIFRKDSKIEYSVKEDAGSETANDATVSISLELKHG